MEKRYVVLYWDSYDGFKRKIVRTYDNWSMVVNTAVNQLCITEAQIVSISLDTNVPIED